MLVGDYSKYDYRGRFYVLIFAGEGYWDKITRLIPRNGIASLDCFVC